MLSQDEGFRRYMDERIKKMLTRPLYPIESMDLRDFFAVHVIGAILEATTRGHNPGNGKGDTRPIRERIVADAYGIADVMISKRRPESKMDE